MFGLIPGERSEGRGSIHTRNASFPPHKGKEAFETVLRTSSG